MVERYHASFQTVDGSVGSVRASAREGWTEKRDCPFALLAVAAKLRAGNPVGLGLGATRGELDRNRLSLRRMRHVDTSDTLNIRSRP